MRIRLVSSILALAALCAVSLAQDAQPAKSTNSNAAGTSGDGKPAAKKAAATPAPSVQAAPKAVVVKPAASGAASAPSTPAPRHPGFFGRVFGSKKASATPEPKPVAATPAPVIPHLRKPRKPADGDETKPADGDGPAEKPAANDGQKTGEPQKPAGTEQPAGTETPANPGEKTESKEPPAAPAATPAPGRRRNRKGAADAKTKEPSSAVQEAIASGDPDAIEKAKYDDLKTRAGDDVHIKELKQKADTAPTEDEGRKASRSYYKALFEKMHSLDDGSVHDRIDLMETAVLKKLGD